MTTSGADFSHYNGRSVAGTASAERRARLAAIVAEGRARDDAAEAERDRRSHLNHLERMHDFRKQIQNDDRFTPEEKADIISQSFEW